MNTRPARQRERRRTPLAEHVSPRVTSRRVWLAWLALAGAAGLFWMAAGELTRRAQAAPLPLLPELASLPTPVRDQIVDADAAARATPASAEVVGALGMAYQASLLDDPALQAYALAETLERDGWRWTYSAR